jgi:hypothetical protein
MVPSRTKPFERFGAFNCAVHLVIETARRRRLTEAEVVPVEGALVEAGTDK